MAISVPFFKQVAQVNKDNINVGNVTYVYKDVSLDLKMSQTNTSIYMPQVNSTDINANYDAKAILNSLFNLFNTNKGERFLFPEYGSDLGKFLFQPVNQYTATALGESIKRLIRRFEPRISVTEVVVFMDLQDNSFEANVYFTILNSSQQAAMSVLLPSSESTSKIIQVNPLSVSNK